MQHQRQGDDKPDLGLLCLLSCEERTSKGTETKHGQSSVPFLTFKSALLKPIFLDRNTCSAPCSAPNSLGKVASSYPSCPSELMKVGLADRIALF